VYVKAAGAAHACSACICTTKAGCCLECCMPTWLCHASLQVEDQGPLGPAVVTCMCLTCMCTVTTACCMLTLTIA
jgi:hypothetical protein